ncbi:MAG: aminotransferase class IV [Candidatus Omnitrophota bacterium]
MRHDKEVELHGAKARPTHSSEAVPRWGTANVGEAHSSAFPTTYTYMDGKPASAGVLLDAVRSEDSDVFDFGLFETLRVYGGRAFGVEEHLERLRESAKTAGYPREPDLPKIRSGLQGSLRDFLGKNKQRDLRSRVLCVRITLWGDRVFFMIGSRERAQKVFQSGVRLRTSPVPKSHPHAGGSQLKTSDYVNGLLAFLEPVRATAPDVLMLDPSGCLAETTAGNIFLVKQKCLLTPSAHGILNGVTRRFVIKCARRLGVPVFETPLTRHEAYNADEAFLTNTSWEILPISQLDARTIGARVPGPVTRKLRQTFQTLIREEASL